MKELGMRLKLLRKEQRIRQNEISTILGIDRSTYSCYETGRITPSSEMLAILARLLGTSTDYLLGLQPLNIMTEPESTYEVDKMEYTHNERMLLMAYRLMDDVQKKLIDEYVKKLNDDKEKENE